MDLTALVFTFFVLSLYSYVKPVTLSYRKQMVTNHSGLSKIALLTLFDSIVFLFSMTVCTALFFALEVF